MYELGNAPKSIAQEYICNLLNGKLNYAVKTSWLDVAFPDDKIYIEYDGSGHFMNVSLKNITMEEKEQKDRQRFYGLKKDGWKLIRIKSLKDKLPGDEIILDLFLKAKTYLLKGNSWFEIDIDNDEISTSKSRESANTGELRSTYKLRKLLKQGG